MEPTESAITITFGDCAENHVGMQKLGNLAPKGFTLGELQMAKNKFEAEGFVCELIDLVSRGVVEDLNPDPASLLIVRRGAEAFSNPDSLRNEQFALTPDTRALMRGRVVNKTARYNLCFADTPQEPNYEKGQGRVVSFGDVPFLETVRSGLEKFFGPKAKNLYAEGNYYYDVQKCGIGFHGDSERKIVVALRFGEPIPLHYQWYYYGGSVGRRIVFDLADSDLYAMSEKAVGFDWKHQKIPTLRHAAGCRKYLAL